MSIEDLRLGALFASLLLLFRVGSGTLTPLFLDSLNPSSTVIFNTSYPSINPVPVLPSGPSWERIDPFFCIWISMGFDSLMLGIIVVLMKGFAPGSITDRETSFPKSTLLLCGSAQAVSALLFQFSSSGSRTAPYLFGVLGYFFIPIAFSLRFLILRKRPTRRQLLCAGIIVLAEIVSLIPSMFPELESQTARQQEGGAAGVGRILWPMCMVASGIPHAVWSIILETTVKTSSHDERLQSEGSRTCQEVTPQSEDCQTCQEVTPQSEGSRTCKEVTPKSEGARTCQEVTPQSRQTDGSQFSDAKTNVSSGGSRDVLISREQAPESRECQSVSNDHLTQSQHPELDSLRSQTADIKTVLTEVPLTDTPEIQADIEVKVHEPKSKRDQPTSSVPDIRTLNMAYIMFWNFFGTFLTTILLFWVDLIPGFGLMPDINIFGKQFLFNMQCIVGATPKCGFHQIFTAWGRMIFKTSSFVTSGLLLRYSDGANFYAIMAALTQPIKFLVFTLFDEQPFRWHPHATISTWLSIAALCVMFPTVIVYARSPTDRTSDVVRSNRLDNEQSIEDVTESSPLIHNQNQADQSERSIDSTSSIGYSIDQSPSSTTYINIRGSRLIEPPAVVQYGSINNVE